jgi:hypothetical protein
MTVSKLMRWESRNSKKSLKSLKNRKLSNSGELRVAKAHKNLKTSTLAIPCSRPLNLYLRFTVQFDLSFGPSYGRSFDYFHLFPLYGAKHSLTKFLSFIFYENQLHSSFKKSNRHAPGNPTILFPHQIPQPQHTIS